MKTWTYSYPGGHLGQIVATDDTNFLVSVEPPDPIRAAGRGLEIRNAKTLDDAVAQANAISGQQSIAAEWVVSQQG
ncbi:MAG: hypothetical protein AAB403_09845 [Planctomycetota bacterium]